jgi:hypothetical protein
MHVAGDTTRLLCATLDDLHVVQRDLAGAIQGILAGLGVPPRLASTTRAGWGREMQRPDTNIAFRRNRHA